jgi:hypothetical protein
MSLEIGIEDSDDASRCEGMVGSPYGGGLTPHRCSRAAVTSRMGHRVCSSHANILRIRYFNDDDDGLLHG